MVLPSKKPYLLCVRLDNLLSTKEATNKYVEGEKLSGRKSELARSASEIAGTEKHVDDVRTWLAAGAIEVERGEIFFLYSPPPQN